jgi:hypothetical protein
MLEPGLAPVILVIFIATLVVSYWRKVLFLLLVVTVAIFCFGLYNLALLLE